MKKLKYVLKRDWYMLLIILAGFVIGAYFYSRLPKKVPIHWDINGNASRYGSKTTGAFLLPIINLIIYLFFVLQPYIDPKGKNYAKFKGSYQLIKTFVITMLFIMQAASLMIATGKHIDIGAVCGIFVSLLFVIFGSVMGKIRHNYSIGIRNPWTLANEEVWQKTHKVSGPLWVLAGIITFLVLIFARQFFLPGLITSIVFIIVITSVYSYIAFRKLK